MLCTVEDQPLLLRELHRVLDPKGRLGLLVFVAASETLSEQPVGNIFPTDERLRSLLAGARLRVTDSATAGDFAAGPRLWQERVDAVEAELERRHGGDRVWQTASRQAAIIGRLLVRASWSARHDHDPARRDLVDNPGVLEGESPSSSRSGR